MIPIGFLPSCLQATFAYKLSYANSIVINEHMEQSKYF